LRPPALRAVRLLPGTVPAAGGSFLRDTYTPVIISDFDVFYHVISFSWFVFSFSALFAGLLKHGLTTLPVVRQCLVRVTSQDL